MPRTMLDVTLHDGLQPVGGLPHPAYASAGVDAHAVAAQAIRVGRAHADLRSVVAHDPAFALLVLDEHDWPTRSMHPVYGMPNCRAGNLIVAATPNPLWAGFADLATAASNPQREAVIATYATAGGTVDLTTFFDLLAVHELFHVFLEDAGIELPRLWLMELVCNLALHHYVAACEPDQLSTLEVLPRAVAALDRDQLEHHSLAAFEARYAFGMDPINYGWYQCRLHEAAAKIHAATGGTALRTAWTAFAEAPHATMGDSELELFLDTHISPMLGEVLRTW